MNQIDLKNRHAIVTGGARGIGYAVAERLLASGAHVALWDMDASKLASSVAALQAAHPGQQVSGQVLDISDDASVQGEANALAAHWGRIDILVNNAGITGGNGLTWELEPAVWRQVIEVNLIAPYLTCRAVVPHMLAGGWGRIVNIASVAGKEGNPNASHYSASKAGLIGLTKSLGKELAQKNVLVNAITPGYTLSETQQQTSSNNYLAMQSEGRAMGRAQYPEDLVGAVMFLSSAASDYMTGQTINVDGGKAMH